MNTSRAASTAALSCGARTPISAPASGRVWQIVSESKLPLRDAWAIENYVNDPRTTAEADLVTEILVPTL